MTQWIVSSCVLILFIIALRFLLRGRIKPMVQYALWALVLARLLVPVSLGSTAISVENTIEKTPVIQQLAMAEEVKHFVYHVDGTATGYSEFSPVLDHTPLRPVSKPVPQSFTTQQAQQISKFWSVGKILRQVWFAGMAVTGLAFLLSNLLFALRLRKTRKPDGKDTLPVYVTAAVETPCLFGLFRPAIYLPTEVAAEESHRAYSVAHELTHYRHGDAFWSVLRCVCIVVHWYNPLVWWAAILCREDCEMACDEETIARLGEEHRGDYGRVLVDLTCRKRTDLLQTATTMTGSAKGLKKRIGMIVKKPKMAIYTLFAVVLVAAIAVGCTFTDSDKDQEPIEPDTSSSSDTSEDQADDKQEDKTPLEGFAGTPISDRELKSFTAMFTGIPEGINWYNNILACGPRKIDRGSFDKPENIHLGILFGNGGFQGNISYPDDWTPEELAFIQGFYPGYPQNWGDLYRLPVEKINEVLQAYLGITLDQTNQVGLDNMEYFSDTDCYFTGPTGAGMDNFQFTQGIREENGTVYLVCEDRWDNRNADLISRLLLCLIPNHGNTSIPYRVYSCIDVTPPK